MLKNNKNKEDIMNRDILEHLKFKSINGVNYRKEMLKLEFIEEIRGKKYKLEKKK